MSVPTLVNGAKVSEKLVALTWNTNSLGPKNTQMQFLSYFRKSKVNVTIFVDTRLQGNLEDCFKKFCGGRAFFNSHTSNSRGIAVLLKEDLEVEDVEFENMIIDNLS